MEEFLAIFGDLQGLPGDRPAAELVEAALRRLAAGAAVGLWQRERAAVAYSARPFASDLHIAAGADLELTLGLLHAPLAGVAAHRAWRAAAIPALLGVPDRAATAHNARSTGMGFEPGPLAAVLAGELPPESLRGSFAGLACDPAAGRAAILSDKLGSRAVFLAQLPGAVCVASDIRLLLALPFVDTTLDMEAVAQLVRSQMIFPPRTLYRAIAALPPASICEVDLAAGTARRRRSWQLSFDEPYASADEAAEATIAAFDEATELMLAGSERVALLLSGGFDSRMLLAFLSRRRRAFDCLSFAPGLTDELLIARQIARAAAVGWQALSHDAPRQWALLEDALDTVGGPYSLYHAHTRCAARSLAEQGYDTIVDGWGLDLPFSGSYFPKETFRVLGRDLTTYRLGRLDGAAATVAYLTESLDLHGGQFARSLLRPALAEQWREALPEALRHVVAQAAEQSDSPYDWVDLALFGGGVTRFRSFPMVAGIRAAARERNPLFDDALLDVYRRLPHQWRFLGPVFRQALAAVAPEIAEIPYANTGARASAPPVWHAISMQARAIYRANHQRVSSLARRVGVAIPAPIRHGSYVLPEELAARLAGDDDLARRLRTLLCEGPLADALLDPGAVRRALAAPGALARPESLSLLTLASLALWLDRNPARFPTG